ncbi:MAG: hypothetical protein M0Q38_06385 [Bacteroidales bacterium]|jgi:hypothetical protein|nr:hypothetical protein [Bacteroidales bacterium]
MNPTLKILIIAVLALASSCSPSARLTRLLSRHPELTMPDTLTIRDTITVPTVVADTLIPTMALKDTVWLRSGRLEIALQATPKTLYVKGKCKADTIVRTHRVITEKIKVIKPNRTDALIAKIPWLVVGLITIAAITWSVISRLKVSKTILP